MVAEALGLLEFAAGGVCFEQGEAGDKFYVVKEGVGGWQAGAALGRHASCCARLPAAVSLPPRFATLSGTSQPPLPALPALPACPLSPGAVVLTKDGVEQGRLGAGDHFGEEALINDAPRAVTAYGARPATMLPCAAPSRGLLLQCLPCCLRCEPPGGALPPCLLALARLVSCV